MEDENYYGIIYCAINLVNKKRYIGQTIRSLENRRRQHLNAKSDTAFCKALNKYDEHNFSWEVICEVPFEDLDKLEKKYIREFDSLENGYNMTEGGDGGDTLSMNPNNDEIRKKLSEVCIGENHYLNQMTEKERDEWIKNNMCGENHSHRKHCGSEEEYQRWLDENKKGNNSPIKRKFTTEEEFQEWVDRTYRGENHYTKRMSKEEYEEWLRKQKAKTYSLSEETKKKMSESQRNTSKNKRRCIVILPNGKDYLVIGISSFCRDYFDLYNIKLNRRELAKIAKGKKKSKYKGFWCRFYNEERDFNIPKWKTN